MKKAIIILVLGFLYLLISTNASEHPVNITRDLPAAANPGQETTVTLTMEVDEENRPDSLGVTEYVPEGWEVISVSEGGEYDVQNDLIEWLFWTFGTPVQDQTFTYTIQVPETASGTYNFSGIFDYGEPDDPSIGGDEELLIVDFDASVSRTLPSLASADSLVEVTLSLDVNETNLPDSITITEAVPSEFGVANVSMNGTYTAETNTIEWAFGDGGNPLADCNLSYSITTPDETENYTFSGTYDIVSGEITVTDTVSGDVALVVTSSYDITATRDMLDMETAGNNLTVTLVLDVDESQIPNALGISETIPEGWTLLTSDCNGIYISPNKVEFLLSTLSLCAIEDQNITYVLQIPNDAVGEYAFSGTLDYGGYTNPAVDGDAAITIVLLTGDFNGDGIVELGEVVDMINDWVDGEATLSDAIDAITNWAAQAG